MHLSKSIVCMPEVVENSYTIISVLIQVSFENCKCFSSHLYISPDPTDLDSPKPSVPSCGSTKVGFTHATPPVSPACVDEDLSMILPNTQVLTPYTDFSCQ